MKQKSQSFIFAIGGGLLILAAILIAGFVIAANKNAETNQRLNGAYQRAMYEVKDNLNNIEINLSKLIAAGDGKLGVEIAGDVARQSQSASDNLKNLPMDYHSVESANKFLNQVGDFCVSYSRALVNGKNTDVYEEKLQSLYDAAHDLNERFTEISDSVGEGKNIIAELNRIRLDSASGLGEETLINNPVEYPELIYDGPFSDTRGKKNFKLLDELPEVDFSAAKQKLKEYLGDMRLTGLKQEGRSEEPEAFFITGYADGKKFFASVSEKGGKLISFNIDTSVTGGVRITEQKARDYAREYAARADFRDLEEVWYNASEGIAVVNLAPIRNGIVYYTDLVKVKLSLEDGALIGIEAAGYCTNHCDRNLSPTISENTALLRLPNNFSLIAIRPALIPLNNAELLTYELACEHNGMYYFIYVDAVSGETVNIMRVINDNRGQLVL